MVNKKPPVRELGPPTEEVRVRNQLVLVKNNRRASDLFARILRAVEEETEEQERKRRDNDNGGTSTHSKS